MGEIDYGFTVNRDLRKGKDVSFVEINSKRYEDENLLVVVENVLNDMPELGELPIKVETIGNLHYSNTVWGFEHKDYDIVHVDMTMFDTPYVEVLLYDIYDGTDETYIDSILNELIRFSRAETVHEALEYGKLQTKRKYISLVSV